MSELLGIVQLRDFSSTVPRRVQLPDLLASRSGVYYSVIAYGMVRNARDDELHIPAITPGNVDWPLFLYHNIDFHALLFLHPLSLRSRPCALALL